MSTLLRVGRYFMIKTDIEAASNLLLLENFKTKLAFRKRNEYTTPPGYFLPTDFKSLTRVSGWQNRLG